MSSLPEQYFSPEEYLELERQAEYKSEYLFGQIYAMAGASTRHIIITANLTSSLHPQLRGSPFRAYPTELRVKVPSRDYYTYPDVSVACGKLEFDPLDASTVTNPKVIFEVLSKSTEAYDRGDKFTYYRQLSTLTDYILVAQDKCQVEHFTKLSNGEWRYKAIESMEESLDIPSIQCTLALSDLYEDIEFPTESLG